jgi:hypothetical protein
LLEESNFEVLEVRGHDLTNNCFPVGANTLEIEEVKVCKSYVCCDWYMYELPLHIMVRNRKYKENCEIL